MFVEFRRSDFILHFAFLLLLILDLSYFILYLYYYYCYNGSEGDRGHQECVRCGLESFRGM